MFLMLAGAHFSLLRRVVSSDAQDASLRPGFGQTGSLSQRVNVGIWDILRP